MMRKLSDNVVTDDDDDEKIRNHDFRYRILDLARCLGF